MYRVQVRELEWPEQKLGFVPSDPFLCCFWGLCCTVESRGRPIIGADFKHFYDYQYLHFQNWCADKIIKFWNALFGSNAACWNSPLCGPEQSPPTAHLICWESQVGMGTETRYLIGPGAKLWKTGVSISSDVNGSAIGTGEIKKTHIYYCYIYTLSYKFYLTRVVSCFYMQYYIAYMQYNAIIFNMQ